MFEADTAKYIAKVDQKLADVKEAADPIKCQLQSGNYNKIITSFNEFLNTICGDKVNSTNKKMLNPKFAASYDAENIQRRADAHEMTLVEYMDSNHYYGARNQQPYISTGHSFGVCYYTGRGSRTHTIKFPSGALFGYITKEHASLISNKLKRECVQALIQFRDDFVIGLNELSTIVPVAIPVTLDDVLVVSYGQRNNPTRDRYKPEDTAFVFDDYNHDMVTHCTVSTDSIRIWDGEDTIDFSGYYYTPSLDAVIGCSFFHLNEETKKYRDIANVTIRGDRITTNLDTAKDTRVRDMPHNDKSLALAQIATLGNYREEKPLGICFDVDNLVNHPTIQAELSKRVKFFDDMMTELVRIKHEYATLYFLNADI